MQESGRTEIIPFICISAFLVQYLLFSTSWAPLGLTLGRGYSFLAYWLCRPLLLLPPIPPSIRVFSNQSTLRIRWQRYWSFSFSISPSNEHPGLISFRMDWLDLLTVQGTLKSSPTPQFKCINSSALSLLHSPTLTFIHDHRKNHSLD